MIARWREVIETDAIEAGLIRPKGRQGQGHSHNLEDSRIAECQVYQGRRIPVDPTYLTVELKIKMLALGDYEHGFRKFVFRKLRTNKSLDSSGIGKKNRETAFRLLDLLSSRHMV